MERRPSWAFVIAAVVIGACAPQSAAGQVTARSPGQHEALAHYEGPPLTLRAATTGAYYLAYRAEREKPMRIDRFEQWIIGEAMQIEEAIAGAELIA